MSKSIVYFQPVTQANDVVALQAKFKQLIKKSGLCDGIGAGEIVAIKTHMGEKNNKFHISPKVIKVLADKLKSRAAKPFVTDTNVIYHGRRMNAVDHAMLAHEHGFTIETVGCPVIIADGVFGENSEDVPLGQRHCPHASVVRMLRYLENLVTVSHVTGHMLTGMAASIKNVGMGLASRAGKFRQHSGIKPRIDPEKCVLCRRCVPHCPADALREGAGHIILDEDKCVGCAECVIACKYDAVKVDYSEQVDTAVEKNAEYALAVLRGIRRKVFFNFAVHITKDCDCMATKTRFIAEDIGIFASSDPVACDKAAADSVLASLHGTDVFCRENPYAAGHLVQLRYAERIGLGSMAYELVKI